MQRSHTRWPYTTGLAKKLDHYVWRLTSAYIFKTPEPIFVILGTHQHHFILNTCVDSIFVNFIIKWRHLAKVISLFVITTSCCLSPDGITLYYTADDEVTIMFTISRRSICQKIVQIFFGYFKDTDIWMQWSRLILQVNNWVVDFMARLRHFCYKYVRYRVNNRCVQNKTMYNLTLYQKSRKSVQTSNVVNCNGPVVLAHSVVTKHIPVI